MNSWTILFLSTTFLPTFLLQCRACSLELERMCDCEQLLHGLSVKCRGANLSSVIEFLKISEIPVQRLIIRDSVIPILSSGDLANVAIKAIDLSGNGLSKIEFGAFDGQTDFVEELVLANNSLNQIPPLGRLPQLILLNLDGNQLEDISEMAFIGTPILRQLRLERNQICRISRNALNETKSTLELLDLSDNCLTTIPAQNLRGSSQLTYLDLSANKIGNVPNLQFMNLPNLKELRLNDNKIRWIGPMAFMNVPLLQYLYIRGNKLAVLEPYRYQSFQNLQVLDLSNNKIRVVPTSSFKDVSNLKKIYLDNNLIRLVETLAFNANPKLQLISLKNNKLSTLLRNAFDSLDQMVILLLANNTISEITRGMFAGMPNLQQLSLRNNSIAKIGHGTFGTVPKLTTLDLAYNRLSSLNQLTFDGMDKLFWLDLSNNQLTSFVDGTFKSKISNILLDNNPLECDRKINWLVDFLVRKKVRTFLPYQSEVVCTAPKKYAGVRLKELMIKKANETFVKNMQNLEWNGIGNLNPLLANFLPSAFGNSPVRKIDGLSSIFGAIPHLGAITQAIPALNNIPGVQLLPMDRSTGTELDQAIKQFAGPLSNMISSGNDVNNANLHQLLDAIPNLVTNLPGGIDIRKLPPNLISHVLQGGNIPGVPRSTLDRLIKQHMQKMAEVAMAARQGHVDDNTDKYLPPLSTIPVELVADVLQGATLPGLTAEQTQAIRRYYTEPPLTTNTPKVPLDGRLPAEELIKYLPVGFDLTRLPPAVLQAVANGKPFDLNHLPDDLLDSLKVSQPQLFETTENKKNLDDILANLPPIGRRYGEDSPTFRPYDIDTVDLLTLEANDNRQTSTLLRLTTAVGLGAVGALTTVIVVVLCCRRKRRNDDDGASSFDDDQQSEMDKTQLFRPKTHSSPTSDELGNSFDLNTNKHQWNQFKSNAGLPRMDEPTVKLEDHHRNASYLFRQTNI